MQNLRFCVSNLKIASQKTLSFLTFTSKMSILYCNLHIKLDIKFCAQARLFLKVAKPCEASLPNCVRATLAPFKNIVRCVNSVFGLLDFLKMMLSPTQNAWFWKRASTSVIYICKWQSGRRAYTKCMVLQVLWNNRPWKTL